jgi:hypothetical protein
VTLSPSVTDFPSLMIGANWGKIEKLEGLIQSFFQSRFCGLSTHGERRMTGSALKAAV